MWLSTMAMAQVAIDAVQREALVDRHARCSLMVMGLGAGGWWLLFASGLSPPWSLSTLTVWVIRGKSNGRHIRAEVE